MDYFWEDEVMARKPFNIASADSMGIKNIVNPGRPGSDEPKPIVRPIIDPIRDDEVPPQEAPPESKPTPVEEGSVLDNLGIEGGDNGNAFLDDYALIGLIALTAIGVTLLG